MQAKTFRENVQFTHFFMEKYCILLKWRYNCFSLASILIDKTYNLPCYKAIKIWISHLLSTKDIVALVCWISWCTVLRIRLATKQSHFLKGIVWMGFTYTVTIDTNSDCRLIQGINNEMKHKKSWSTFNGDWWFKEQQKGEDHTIQFRG